MFETLQAYMQYIYLSKTGTRMFIEVLLITPNWKLPKCPSFVEWISCGIVTASMEQ
jgi:hypothetical protein